jgi:ATP-dependent DNA helicase DinG
LSFDSFVAIDLETTGLNAGSCEIIEYGAVRVSGGEITERFQSFARPQSLLPPAVTKLTGITEDDLSAAPENHLAFKKFMEFLGNDLLVAHNASFEASFLSSVSGGFFEAEILDSLELSRIMLPGAPSHSLGRLASFLELETESLSLHRAADDAEICAQLWLLLLKHLQSTPQAVLSEIGWMLGNIYHPLKEMLREAESQANTGTASGVQSQYAKLLKSGEATRGKDFEIGDPLNLAPDQLAESLGTSGCIAKELPGYEPRQQQQEMCKAVAETFNQGRHLVLEAGTGIGKSLAYLLPAAAWSDSGERKVVISTNTKNLQSQLFDKDLPLLERALGRKLNLALLKGRRNYLCVRKLLYTLKECGNELDDAERAAMLPVINWAAATVSGDIAECSPLFLPEARDLPDKLTSDGPDCLGRACRQRRKCFLMRARARAQAAQIIVANHSLVFVELGTTSVLPPCEEIIFDEAHNLENAATRHLSVHIWPGRFYRALNRLFKFRARGRGRRRKKAHNTQELQGTGLLPSLFDQAAKTRGAIRDGLLDRLEGDAAEASQLVVQSIDELATFNATLLSLWSSSRGREKLRYSNKDRRMDQWDPILIAKKSLLASLSSLEARVRRISDVLKEDTEAAAFPRSEELGHDFASAADNIRTLLEDIDFTVKADDSRYVFWAELSGRGGDQPELWGAPIEVGPMLAELVFGKKRSCILCSATMTVNGNFDYLLGRLGLAGMDNVDCLSLGTPFDFEKQTDVMVPAWLPEPGYASSGRNSTELASLLEEVCLVTGGRSLVLFTSYGAMDEVYNQLKPQLDPHGIQVLAQGRDGSREALLAALHHQENIVLMGTSSFWEGIDVRGAALSCLVMTRLPFQVYTDPLFKARAELVESRGDSSFMNYSVPEAVLKFRQGFGRLIRSKSDRGIAILADRRLVSKRYGRIFLQSLQCPYRVISNNQTLIRCAEDFFADEENG